MMNLCKACKKCETRNLPTCSIDCPAPWFDEVIAEMQEEETKRLEFVRKQESIAISINVAIKATRANRRKRNQSGIRYY